ncbi:hypothetical protein M0812_21688 [Anaeramoeba flamelloides]|uniref:Dystroglycan-type cadherin-like domain-containing protein n=1 Tax=Anaeramoeba flamelloides TaxID=1746091 RepID=A0AAV7YXV9_9EUKA|nr:hypothetical protein M0812_21688 [Anaeramoeba flamelloides]
MKIILLCFLLQIIFPTLICCKLCPILEKTDKILTSNSHSHDNLHIQQLEDDKYCLIHSSYDRSKELVSVYGYIITSEPKVLVGPVVLVSGNNLSPHHYESAVLNGSARIVLTWEAKIGNVLRVTFQVFDYALKNTTDQIRVHNPPSANFTDYSSSILSIGSGELFVLSWAFQDLLGSDYILYYDIFDSKGKSALKAGPNVLSNSTNNEHLSQKNYLVDQSKFLITWNTRSLVDVQNATILFQIIGNDGSPFGKQQAINDQDETLHIHTKIQMFSSLSRFLIVWACQKNVSSNYQIYGKYYSYTSKPIGKKFTIQNKNSEDQLYPQVLPLSTQSKWILSWSQYSNQNRFDIYAQLFENLDTPIGSAFLVNNYTDQDQVQSELILFKNDTFLVIWKSFGQDSDLNGIYGQYYQQHGQKIGLEFRINQKTGGSQEGLSYFSVSNEKVLLSWITKDQANVDSQNNICLQRRMLSELKPKSAMPKLQYTGNTAFSYIFSDSIFNENHHAVKYKSQLQSLQPLPDWLKFDPDVKQLFGTPPNTAQNLSLIIKATNNCGFSSVSNFNLVINKKSSKKSSFPSWKTVIGILIPIVLVITSVVITYRTFKFPKSKTSYQKISSLEQYEMTTTTFSSSSEDRLMSQINDNDL